MKDYLIFLKGGNCIEGTTKEEILIELDTNFCNYKRCVPYTPRIYEFTDDDGITMVDFEEVQAIAINKPYNAKKVGFEREGKING